MDNDLKRQLYAMGDAQRVSEADAQIVSEADAQAYRKIFGVQRIPLSKDPESQVWTKQAEPQEIEFLSHILKKAKKELNLSAWGEIELSAFTDDALAHALFKFSSLVDEPENPIMWVCITAKRYMDANGTAMKFNFRSALRDKYRHLANRHTFYASAPIPLKKPYIALSTTNTEAKYANKGTANAAWAWIIPKDLITA